MIQRDRFISSEAAIEKQQQQQQTSSNPLNMNYIISDKVHHMRCGRQLFSSVPFYHFHFLYVRYSIVHRTVNIESAFVVVIYAYVSVYVCIDTSSVVNEREVIVLV